MTMLLIYIPDHIEDDDELADWVVSNPELFYGAMDLDASQYDERAIIDDIRITDVQVAEDTVSIYYEFEWSTYYGCRDMDFADTTDIEVIDGTRQGNTLSFEKFKPRERRSTVDEF